MDNYPLPATPFLANYRENPSSLHSWSTGEVWSKADNLFLFLPHLIFSFSVAVETEDTSNITVPPFVRSPQMYVDTIKHATFPTFRDLTYSRNLFLPLKFDTFILCSMHRKWRLSQDQKRVGYLEPNWW